MFLCKNTIIKEHISKILMMRSFKEIIICLWEKIYGINLNYLKFFNREGANLVRKVKVNIPI